jgi:autotransporter-associated beta strand protein
MTLTWDPSGGGTSDGGGTWLDTGKWWNGTANANWGNSTPDNAVIGNGGTGGNITLGTVNAGTVLFDNFTGTYALKSGSLNQNDGITVGANAGSVSLESPVSGTGGVTVNGPSRVNFRSGAKTFTGDIIINGGGEVLEYNMDMGTGNLTLNDGVLVDYWAGNMNRTLGSGPGQVQILGGASGFCGQGANGVTIRLNNSDGELVWGSTYFNPSTLVLQSPWANTNGKLTWRNVLDLNGATRTIKVNKNHEGRTDGYANMINPITNNAGTAAGLIKEGPGRLILSAANTYDGGTQVTDGFLAVNGSLADASMAISGGTVSGSGTLTFNVAGAATDRIVMTGGTLDATGLAVNVSGTLTASEYVLVDATGGGSITGTFASLAGAPGYALDYGTANQVKLVGPGGGSAYDTWKAANAPTGNPDDDYDLDGVSNAVEFVLGGTSATNDLDKLPVTDANGTNMTFTFLRKQSSIDPKTALWIEVSPDLVNWTTSPSPYTVADAAAANNPGVTVVKDTPANYDTVTLTVPQDSAKKFARLKVVIMP